MYINTFVYIISNACIKYYIGDLWLWYHRS